MIIFGTGGSHCHHCAITSQGAPELLLGKEHAITQELQAALNFPFIQQWFCPKKGIFTPRNAGKSYSLGFGRIYRKIRKAQQHPGRLLFPPHIQAIAELPGFSDQKCGSFCVIAAAMHA